MSLRRPALILSIVCLLAFFVVQDRIAIAEVLKQDQICDATADYFLGVEDYPKAVEIHRALISARPSNALAHYHLGFAYGMLGKSREELFEYRRAVDLGLKQWDLFLNLGILYLEEDQIQAATRALTSAVLLGPNHSEAHYNLGLVFERQRIFGKARRELAQSLQLDPNQPDARNTMAIIDLQEGKNADARKLWSELTRTQPNFAPACANLAILDGLDRRDSCCKNDSTNEAKCQLDRRLCGCLVR
jgi:Flp pilus assembly protein TadD